MKSNIEQLGSKLKDIRKSHHLTSKQTAELLEVTTNHWGLIERNKTLPSLELLILFCQKFQVPLGFLLTETPITPDSFTLPDDSKALFDLQPNQLFTMREVLQAYIASETSRDGLIDGPKMGQQLKFARQKKQLTLKQVAILTGITEKHLQSLEKGKNIPTLNTLKSLITALEISPDWLFANELPAGRILIYQEIKDDFEKLPEDQQHIVKSLIKGYLSGIKSINNT